MKLVNWLTMTISFCQLTLVPSHTVFELFSSFTAGCPILHLGLRWSKRILQHPSVLPVQTSRVHSVVDRAARLWTCRPWLLAEFHHVPRPGCTHLCGRHARGPSGEIWAAAQRPAKALPSDCWLSLRELCNRCWHKGAITGSVGAHTGAKVHGRKDPSRDSRAGESPEVKEIGGWHHRVESSERHSSALRHLRRKGCKYFLNEPVVHDSAVPLNH